MLTIRHAAVVGAGTMGAQIAALLASIGIPVLLLDLAPTELSADEQHRGLTLADPTVRLRPVRALFERMKKLSPAPFFTLDAATLITLGTIDDNLSDLARADWVIEAILERLDLKQALHAKLAAHTRTDALITTNTSGLPIHRIVESLPLDYRRRFFATHFFNPPRSMRLLELVSTPDTAPSLLAAFTEFATATLGKGVVLAKDTPGFIANRIGCFDLQTALWLAHTEHRTIEEVDALTGALIGRPASGTFRLCDLVGLDLVSQLGRNLRELLPSPTEQQTFAPPPFLATLIQRGWLGEKSRQGFYQRVQTAQGREIHPLDLATFAYRPTQRPSFASLATIVALADLTARLRALCASDDPAGRFAWHHLSAVLCYTADHVPEISDDILAVDLAMQWGFNWELGPFALWDALGVAATAERLAAEGRSVPALVQQLLSRGHTSFYQNSPTSSARYEPATGSYADIPVSPRRISLPHLKARGRTLLSGQNAHLVDLGDGVACFEFNTKMNVIGSATLATMETSLDLVRRDFAALVIGNQGSHFSAGANLKEFVAHIESARWTEVERMLITFQHATSTLRQFEKPVVAAVHGLTLGGGCEFALGCDHVVAFAETTMGLPEVGVGLIPGAHGSKEMLVRCTESILRNADPDFFAGVRLAWETISSARLSTSAPDAAQLRFLRAGEWTLELNRDHLLDTAKRKALQLTDQYRPTLPRTNIPAVGLSGFTTLKSTLNALHAAGRIGDHDRTIGTQLARVLCGGELTQLHFVPESYILELEREAFLSLCGEPRTLDRIRHLLGTGKPLKN